MDSSERSPRILIIRRDNIGDLVCTTPLIRALREQLPHARIAALVTRYNRAVMDGNPDIDALFSYTKAKHVEHGESKIGIYWNRLETIWKLRRERFDWILLPGGPQRSSLRFAKWIGARQILIRDQADAMGGLHHVEQCCHLLVRMGLGFAAPAARLSADPALAARMQKIIPKDWNIHHGPVIALLLSARKPSQRWPADRFASVARHLHKRLDAKFLLLWSPGPADNPLHPGDDEKSQAVLKLTNGIPMCAIPTEKLEELIAALTLCDAIICSDGGAMHLGAALGKPMISLFGDSDPEHWGPWKVPHTILQKASRDVSDISVEDVVGAFLKLQDKASILNA